MPIPLIAAMGLLGAGTAAARSIKGRGEHAQEGRNAALQSAWAGLTGGPMGQITTRKPNLLMDTAEGAGKGILGGYGMETARMAALNPQGSATVINTTAAPVETPMPMPTPAREPLSFAPVTPAPNSRFGQEMNDVYNMQAKHTESMPFWMYGGTGSSKLQAQKNKKSGWVGMVPGTGRKETMNSGSW